MVGETAATASIAFIGFGEAAQAFLTGWRTGPASPLASRPTTSRPIRPMPPCAARKRVDYRGRRDLGAASAPEAVAGARRCFPSSPPIRRMKPRSPRFRASPQAPSSSTAIPARRRPRRERRREVDAAGGRYVDVAVMAPVHPRLHRTPLLISGPHVGGRRGARRARHGGRHPRRPGRLGFGGQDDPFDHDEGPRGAGRRMRARRDQGRRNRHGARIARRHLSGVRLEERARPTCSSGSRPMGCVAPPKCARSRGP